MPDTAKPKLRPLFKLKIEGLRVARGIDTRGKHLQISFEAPSQLNNAPAYYYNNLAIGMYSYIRSGTVRHIDSIGRYCSIGPGVTIAEAEHPTNWLSTSSSQYGRPQFAFYPPDVELAKRRCMPMFEEDSTSRNAIIGHDVWIGGGATLRRSVKIGHGAIVAGNAFVTRDVPPYAIVGGLPAKIMRFRFDHGTIVRLLKLRWWRYNINDFGEIPFNDINRAIDLIQAKKAAREISQTHRIFRTVHINTKGFHSLTETPEIDKSAFPKPSEDPLGLPLYRAHLARQREKNKSYLKRKKEQIALLLKPKA